MATAILFTPDAQDMEIAAYPTTNTYDWLTGKVGGYVEVIQLGEVGDISYSMWINEEGKLKGLPFNYNATDVCAALEAIFPWDGIVGPAVIISGEIDDEGNERGLEPHEEQVFIDFWQRVCAE